MKTYQREIATEIHGRDIATMTDRGLRDAYRLVGADYYDSPRKRALREEADRRGLCRLCVMTYAHDGYGVCPNTATAAA